MKETNITVLMVEPGKNPVVTTIKFIKKVCDKNHTLSTFN